jgi:WD40 repeat protein
MVPLRFANSSSTYDSTIRVWDINTFTCLLKLGGQDSVHNFGGFGIYCLAFKWPTNQNTEDDDGDNKLRGTLFAAAEDNTVTVWVRNPLCLPNTSFDANRSLLFLAKARHLMPVFCGPSNIWLMCRLILGFLNTMPSFVHSIEYYVEYDANLY